MPPYSPVNQLFLRPWVLLRQRPVNVFKFIALSIIVTVIQKFFSLIFGIGIARMAPEMSEWAIFLSTLILAGILSLATFPIMVSPFLFCFRWNRHGNAAIGETLRFTLTWYGKFITFGAALWSILLLFALPGFVAVFHFIVSAGGLNTAIPAAGLIASAFFIPYLFAFMRFTPAFFFFADSPQLGVGHALRVSWNTMNGHGTRLFILYVTIVLWAFIVLLLISLIAPGNEAFITFISIPIAILFCFWVATAISAFYEDLIAENKTA